MTQALATKQNLDLLTPDKIADFLDRASAVEKFISALRDEAKRRLTEDPESVPGWKLKPGAKKSSIDDTAVVFSRLKTRYDVLPTDFAEVCTLPKKNLETLLRQYTKKKGRELDDLMAEIIAGTTVETQNAPSLERAR